MRINRSLGVAAGWVTSTLMMCGAVSASQPKPFVPPDSVEMHRDLVYAEHDGDRLLLDVLQPRVTTASVPVVLFVGCGGWISGQKAQFWRLGSYLAERGFVAVTTQCRRAPATRYPTQMNDTLDAVRWIRSHASEYKGDPSRLAIAGGSAGAHLAALIGTNRWNGSEWIGARPNERVQAVIAMSAGLDFTLKPDGPNVVSFLGATFAQNPTVWREASPVNQVTSQAAPFLLLVGSLEDQAHGNAVVMQRRLTDAGVKAELFTAEGADHGFPNLPEWYPVVADKVLAFLTAIFKTR